MKVVFKQLALDSEARCLYALDAEGRIWCYKDDDTWRQMRGPNEDEFPVSPKKPLPGSEHFNGA